MSRIDEEIDLYGFSLVGSLDNMTEINDRISDSPNDKDSSNLLDLFRSDENWNNPESVSLMMKAYGIENSYDNHIQEVESGFTYITIRDEQKKMFAARFMSEARRLMDSGKYSDSLQSITESLRYDPSSIESLLLRVDLYNKLGMIIDAIKDCRQVLQMDSNNPVASEYLFRRNINISISNNNNISSSSSSSTGNGSKFSGFGLSATIDKIRLSMRDHPLSESQSILSDDRLADNEDNNDRAPYFVQPSDDDSSSSSSSSNSIEERKAAKKRKKKKKKKRKKSKKSSKHDSKKRHKSEKSSTTDLAEDSG